MMETLKNNNEIDIDHSDLSLTDLKKQHPNELRDWCLKAEFNGHSYFDYSNDHYCSIHFPDGSRAETSSLQGNFNGKNIKHGPQLRATEFLEAIREKNPDNGIFAFQHKVRSEGKEGLEYYFVVDVDFDKLNLPDGYGLRAGGLHNYASSCGYDDRTVGQVICHEETFMLSTTGGGSLGKNKEFFETGRLNTVESDGATEATKSQKGQLFPEQYRVVVYKQASQGEKDPWLYS